MPISLVVRMLLTGAGNNQAHVPPSPWAGLGITDRWPMDDAHVDSGFARDVVGGLDLTLGSSVASAAGPFTQARQFPTRMAMGR
jgi:hypothetical protein